ncbi:hypothetical protein [Halorubrum trapanicum]|uniref:hypothetical protein n=1 Tax=Halorubrum trapanicum TaxID=29284 RepID=UPI003C6F5A90
MGLTSLVKKVVKSLTGGNNSASTEKQKESEKDVSGSQDTQTRTQRTFGASDHAVERWNERFPDNNGVSVVEACVDGISGQIPTKDQGEYYYYPPLNAILVVEAGTVITTYPKENVKFEPHNHVVKCTGCGQAYEPADYSSACPWCGHEGQSTGNVAFER